MPRNVRNFWIETRIDGRKTKMAGGPVSKDGGFVQDIFIRNHGAVEKALTVVGRVQPDGALDLIIEPVADVWRGNVIVVKGRR